jgi:hypothetical protein
MRGANISTLLKPQKSILKNRQTKIKLKESKLKKLINNTLGAPSLHLNTIMIWRTNKLLLRRFPRLAKMFM